MRRSWHVFSRCATNSRRSAKATPCLLVVVELHQPAREDREEEARRHPHSHEVPAHQRRLPGDDPLHAEQRPRRHVGDERAQRHPGIGEHDQERHAHHGAAGGDDAGGGGEADRGQPRLRAEVARHHLLRNQHLEHPGVDEGGDQSRHDEPQQREPGPRADPGQAGILPVGEGGGGGRQDDEDEHGEIDARPRHARIIRQVGYTGRARRQAEPHMQQTFLIGSALVALAVLALVAAGVVTGQPVDPLTLARATSGFALIALGAVWVLWRRMEAALVAHKRALSDLGAREQRVTAFAGVNAALSQEIETDALLHRITDTLAQLTGAPCVVLWGTDLAGRRLHRQAWTMEPQIARLNLPYELSFDQGVTGWIARQHEAVVISDVATDPRMYEAGWCIQHGLNAFAGAPVLEGGELAGVLTLNMRDIDALGGEGEALLVSFAAQAALAIRNARLISVAEKRRREAEALAQELADSLRALLGSRTSGLYRLDAATGEMVSVATSGDIGPGHGRRIVFPPGIGVAALAARERRPVITANLLTDPRITLTPEVRARIEQAHYRAVLSVPLVARDTAIGALSAGDDEGRVFAPDDVRLAEAVADQAALTLDNARLYVEA